MHSCHHVRGDRTGRAGRVRAEPTPTGRAWARVPGGSWGGDSLLTQEKKP